MIEKIEKQILKHWDEFGFSAARPQALSFALFSKPQTEGKTLLYAFDKSSRSPLCVVKVIGQDSDSEKSSNQFDNMNFIHERLSAFSDSLPRPLLREDIVGNIMYIETFTSGTPIRNFILSSNRKRHLKDAIKWLTDFHKASVSDKLDNNGLRGYLSGVDFEVLSEKAVPARFFMENELSRCPGVSVPLVFSHHDFSGYNVLFSRNKISVLDWEHSKRQDLPACDLFNIIIFYYYDEKSPFLKSFIRAFDAKNRLIRDLINDYFSGLNINRDLSNIFLLKLLIDLYQIKNKSKNEILEAVDMLIRGKVSLR